MSHLRTIRRALAAAKPYDLSEAHLFCFSHLRWRFVYQRPQHLLSRAAKDVRALIYIEEPAFEAGAQPHLATQSEGQVTIVTPILPEGTPEAEAYTLQQRLLQPLLSHAKRPLIFWYYTPMALPFTASAIPDLIVYDNMDELSAFLGAPARLLQLERDLLSRADIVFTGGHSLYEAKKTRHSHVHAFPSSIDARHFVQARSTERLDPHDQAPIPNPRLGFFGVIDERMDLDMVARIADLRPAWQLVMLGPVVKIDPALLPKRANVHWLGPKSYQELPAYIGGWDIGLMPFAINAATRFISPTKTPEFLAAGVPVISSPITDVVRDYGNAGLVAIAEHPEGIVEAAERLLAQPREPWLAAVDRHLSGMSWDKTWSRMRRLMADTVSTKQAEAYSGQSSTVAKGEAHV